MFPYIHFSNLPLAYCLVNRRITSYKPDITGRCDLYYNYQWEILGAEEGACISAQKTTILYITNKMVVQTILMPRIMFFSSMSCFSILILATSSLFLHCYYNPPFISLQSGRGLIIGNPKGWILRECFGATLMWIPWAGVFLQDSLQYREATLPPPLPSSQGRGGYYKSYHKRAYRWE
jgi:hypothetical protein